MDELDAFIERYHNADSEFVKGNPDPYKAVYSHRDDATLANPFGSVSRGWGEIVATLDRAASYYREGSALEYETLARHATRDLSYIVETVRFKARVGGRTEFTDLALRTTSVLRLEHGSWKVVHRHADPITSVRPADSIVGR